MRTAHRDKTFIAKAGCDYFITFYGRAEVPIQLKLDIAVDKGDIVYSTQIFLDPVRQKHYVRFNAPVNGEFLLLFTSEEFEYDIDYEIGDIEAQVIDFPSDARKVIGVCGIWRDWENYNMALQSLLTPKITEDYVVASFTFSQPFTNDEEIETEKEFAEIIKKFNIAALVLFAEMLKMKPLIDRLIQIGKELDVPVIVLEHKYPGVINGIYDYEGGFESILHHITDYHGITDIVMVAGIEGNQFSLQREEIFRNVMREKGIEVTSDDIIYGDFYASMTEQRLNEYLDAGKRLPKAFVCANDATAVGVCDCLKKRGISVPEDVLVTGFDGTSCGKYYYPVITTCQADLSSIGDALLKALNEKEAGNKVDLFDFPIKFSDVINGSCGCHMREESEWRHIVSELAADNQDYFYHDIQMGMFASRTVNLDDLDSAMTGIESALSLWKDQYYYIGLTPHPGCVHTILRGENNSFIHKEKYYDSRRAFPDYWKFVKRGSGKNIMLIRQIRSNGQCHGHIVSCLSDLSLRAQERFEEFGMYVSIIVNSVLKQQSLKAANIKVTRASEHDYLTGLYNRMGFLTRCESMLKGKMGEGEFFTLMSVDMDGLKVINDTYGHVEGDKALKLLADVLKILAEDRAICARYGGDEFALAVVAEEGYTERIEEIRKRTNLLLHDKCRESKLPYTFTASIGSATSQVGENADLELLLRKSDLMMYEDKISRKKERIS